MVPERPPRMFNATDFAVPIGVALVSVGVVDAYNVTVAGPLARTPVFAMFSATLPWSFEPASTEVGTVFFVTVTSRIGVVGSVARDALTLARSASTVASFASAALYFVVISAPSFA